MSDLIIGLVILLIYLVLLGLSIASYVLYGLGMYKIAQKRQIPNPWLAWIPVAYAWTLGSIADSFDEEKGISKKWRVWLLMLNLVSIAMVFVMYIAMFVLAVAAAFMHMRSIVILVAVAFYILMIVLMMVAVAASIMMTICTYKIFEYICPEKSIKYILLSMLLPLAFGICLLKCKDKCPEKTVSVNAAMSDGTPENTMPDNSVQTDTEAEHASPSDSETE